MNNESRFHRAFLTMLVILSVISIKMAYLYGGELLFFLLITIPAVIAILYFKNDYNKEKS